MARNLHLPHTRRDHRIDWPGAVALVIGLVPLLTVAEQGRDWGWASGLAFTMYGIGLSGIALFLLAERAYGDDALLPLRLFRGKTFSIGSSLNFIIGMGMFGGLAALPLYLQIVKGVSPTRAGLLLVPLVAGIMVGSIIAGQVIARTGRYRIFPIAGVVLLVVGMALFSQIGVDTPIWAVMVIAPIFGLGLGGNMQPLVLALQNSVPPQDMGVATSSATFFRQMGGTLGTAVFLSVLFSTVGDKIAGAFKASAATPAFQAALSDPSLASDPNNAAVVKAIKGGSGLPAGALDDTSFLNHLDPRLARPFLIGFSDAIDLVFLCGLGVLLVALVVVFFLPEERLRSVSGIEARRQAEADELSAAAVSAEAAGSSTASSQMVDGETISYEDEAVAAPRRGCTRAEAVASFSCRRRNVLTWTRSTPTDTASAPPSSTMATMPSSHQWLAVPTTTRMVMIGCATNSQRQRLRSATMRPNATSTAQPMCNEGIAANWLAMLPPSGGP